VVLNEESKISSSSLDFKLIQKPLTMKEIPSKEEEEEENPLA